MNIKGNIPRGPGAIPRRTVLQGALGVLSGFAFGSLGPLGCSDEKHDSRTFGPYVIALKSDTPPALAGPEASVFQVKRAVPLPIRDAPEGLPATPPYPRGVWFTPDRLRVQVSYVISNLEDRPVDVELLIDAWNEFIVYSPQVRIVEDEVLPDRSCAQRLMIIPPKGRLEGRVSYDDFERIAIALAGITNQAPNPFHLLDPTTKLDESPLSKPFIPAVISGITGFDLSLRSTAAVRDGSPTAVRVGAEVTVEVIDLDQILMPEGDEGSSSNRRPLSRGRTELIPQILVEED